MDLRQSPKTSDGKQLVASTKPDRPKLTFISHNFCDRSTWYGQSTKVEEEVAVDSGNHQDYTVDNGPLIDTYHGKITFEDLLKNGEGGSYRPVVTVDDVVKTEQDPHYGSGGDYTIDYTNKTVHFLEALQGTEVVKVTYYYSGVAGPGEAPKSTFIIYPIPGKFLILDRVEVQFSKDIELNDSFMFQAYALVDFVAPEMMGPPWNIPSGTKIPIPDPLIYKTLQDLQNDSNGSWVSYPPIGTNWRALAYETLMFRWDYEVGSTILDPRIGAEIRVWMQHDEPCGGHIGVATIYCTSEDVPT